MFFFFVIFILFVCYSTVCRDLFIDQSSSGCDDDVSRDENTLDNPWCSFSNLRGNPKGLLPGDTVHIREGFYEDYIYFNEPRDPETDQRYITIRNYEKENVVIQPCKLFPEARWISSGQEYTLTLAGGDMSSLDTIILVKRNGYGIFAFNTILEMANADSTIVSGNDYSHYNSATRTVSLHPESGTPWDDFFVCDLNSRIKVVSPYVEFRGLTLIHGFEGIKIEYAGSQGYEKGGDYVRVINCTFKYINAMGLLSGQNYLHIEGNTFEYCGKPFKYSGSDIINNNLDHAIYLSSEGKGHEVFDNWMDKCHGCCMHPYPGPTGRFYRNHMGGGMCAWSTNGNLEVFENYIEDYISINAHNSKFYNNILVSNQVYSAGFSNQNQAKNNEWRNNIVVATSAFCLNTGEMDLATTEMDDNLWASCSSWTIGYNGQQVRYNYGNFRAYKEHMIQEEELERNSFYQANSWLTSENKNSQHLVTHADSICRY